MASKLKEWRAIIEVVGAVLIAFFGWLGGRNAGFERGKTEGINAGKTQGISEGKTQGISEGRKGKQPAFDAIPTDVNLGGTRWTSTFEDVGPNRQGSALLTFEQFGSRIVGDGGDTSGRKWIVEGATAGRRVCYIYYEPGGQRLSFGTAFLEMSNNGKVMSGQWVGWAPEGGKLQPRKLTLTRVVE